MATAAPVSSALPALPPLSLPAFSGPLDVLLHYVREHRLAIADIPIVEVTDYYLAFLRQAEHMNLALAGEFILMAATLLEIKSRTLLPRPPRVETADDEQGDDPRVLLVQRLEDYARYKALCETLAAWEGERRLLFFREPADASAYELPPAFGQMKSDSLIRALRRLLAEAGADADTAINVRPRQKLTLRLAMAALRRKVDAAGSDGLSLDECFPRPLVRLEIVMTFLALLELLRQGRILAAQDEQWGEIRLVAVPDGEQRLP